MSLDNQPGRFVWIGAGECIERLGAVEFARLVQRRYAAAPDAAEAVRKALFAAGKRAAPNRAGTEVMLGAVLVALGANEPSDEGDAA